MCFVWIFNVISCVFDSVTGVLFSRFHLFRSNDISSISMYIEWTGSAHMKNWNRHGTSIKSTVRRRKQQTKNNQRLEKTNFFPSSHVRCTRYNWIIQYKHTNTSLIRFGCFKSRRLLKLSDQIVFLRLLSEWIVSSSNYIWCIISITYETRAL